jgi:hypothetical protein
MARMIVNAIQRATVSWRTRASQLIAASRWG